MSPQDELAKADRQRLARRCANGELSIQELREAGHDRFIVLLSDLAELGSRPPITDMSGPNADIRRAGLERLDGLLTDRDRDRAKKKT